MPTTMFKPEREQDVHAGVREAVDPDALPAEAVNGGSSTICEHEQGEQAHADEDGDRAVAVRERPEPRPDPGCLGVVRRRDGRLSVHARSPSCVPNKPAGRKTRDDDEDPEDGGLRPGQVAEVRAGHFDEADEEAADRGAEQVADPAQDRRGERLEAGLEAEA